VWLAWRKWRRTRPFWGGLLVLLGGAEMLLSEKAPLPVVVHIGFLGLAGYLIPVVLLLCALLLWFNPVQRTFYSILAVLLSLGSWITTNLGGFFVGMLLGLIGGSLAFAWERSGGTPVPEPPARPITPQDTPSPGLGLILGDTEPGGLAPWPPGYRPDAPDAGAHGPDQGEPRLRAPEGGVRVPQGGARGSGQDGPSGSAARSPWVTGRTSREIGGFLAVPAAPLLLATFVVLAHPGSGVTPTPTSRPTSTGPSPTGSPSPTVSPSPTGSPSPTVSPSPTKSPSPTTSPSPSPTVIRSAPPQPGRRHARHVRAAAAPAVRASTARSSITAASAVLTGLSFDGVAKVATANGTVRMLKFSMSSLTLSGGTVLTVVQTGHSFFARDSSLAFSGNVVLYTTKFSGDLAGVRVTFTAKKPPPAVLPDMTFTSMIADQPYTTAGSLQASDLKITVS